VAGDPRFFGRTGPHPLREVAAAAGAPLPTGADPDRPVEGIAPLQLAGPDDVSFFDNRRYADALAASGAGIIIIHPDWAPRVPAAAVALLTAEPYLGWARTAALFHPAPPVQPGVHPTAFVDPAAKLDPTAEIGPLAAIAAGAEIGPRCRIGPCATIGAGVVIGADCRVGANASISHAIIGARSFIYPGARIGQEGFGFATGSSGFVTVPQLGRVVIEEDVEVGANTCIDRGSANDTVIGAGSRLDNLVMIGHNVRLGRCCVIVGQAGISGSTVLEDFVVVAAQAGLTGHLKIGRGAKLGAQAGVMADVPAGAEVLGSPSQPVRAFFRQVALLRRLAARGQAGAGARGSDEETD
jgi:UDP-3-O-[3-hydroxymyristoyl] glucosamine N-acyltransferase